MFHQGCDETLALAEQARISGPYDLAPCTSCAAKEEEYVVFGDCILCSLFMWDWRGVLGMETVGRSAGSWLHIILIMQCRDGDLLLVIRGLSARYTDEIIFCQRLCFSLCCIVLIIFCWNRFHTICCIARSEYCAWVMLYSSFAFIFTVHIF